MGGHAPLIGSEVYVFQAGNSGYASAPTNEMTSGQFGSDTTHGNYVLTGVNGTFTVTGDYTCTVGHPVYVATVGGTATPGASLVTITGSSVINNGGSFTIQFTAANSLSVGSAVSFASGAFSAAAYKSLNGTTKTVTAATSTSFTIVGGPLVNGSATGYALVGGLPNPAIANIAVLGNCPGGTNEFLSTLNFVYINEVSTVAAGYALHAFGSGVYTIGAPASNLAGIAAAATNAGQLYNINTNASSPGDALATTSSVGGGNGVVPQATLDTLGNILASCVDSANTSTTPSAQCTTLFNTATSTGDTTGTKPTNISSAAFNIASFPAGTGTQHGTFPATLYALQGSAPTPFGPNLSAAPNDFGIAISYPTSLNTHVGAAESIAVDGNGQIWSTAQTDKSITLWSAVGKVVASNTSGYVYGSVSVDPANSAWTGNATSSTGIEVFSNAGALTSTFGSGLQSAYTVITHQSTTPATSIDAYFFAGATAQGGYWFTPNGDTGNGLTNGAGPAGPYTVAGNFISHGAIDSAGDLWLTSEGGQQITRFTPVTGGIGGAGNSFIAAFLAIATPTVTGAAHQPQPEVPAVDSSNNAWIPLQSTFSGTGSGTPEPGLYEVSTTGGVTTYFSGTGTSTSTTIFTGANFYQAFGAAVDGNGNIWVTNRFNPGLGGSSGDPGASTVIELKGSTGAAISPSTNYTYGGILNDPLNLAIDPSGDIWVTNFGGSSIVEIIGAAAPVVTPLSNAANTFTLGTRP